MVRKARLVNEHFKNIKNKLKTCSQKSVHVQTDNTI